MGVTQGEDQKRLHQGLHFASAMPRGLGLRGADRAADGRLPVPSERRELQRGGRRLQRDCRRRARRDGRVQVAGGPSLRVQERDLHLHAHLQWELRGSEDGSRELRGVWERVRPGSELPGGGLRMPRWGKRVRGDVRGQAERRGELRDVRQCVWSPDDAVHERKLRVPGRGECVRGEMHRSHRPRWTSRATRRIAGRVGTRVLCRVRAAVV